MKEDGMNFTLEVDVTDAEEKIKCYTEDVEEREGKVFYKYTVPRNLITINPKFEELFAQMVLKGRDETYIWLKLGDKFNL